MFSLDLLKSVALASTMTPTIKGENLDETETSLEDQPRDNSSAMHGIKTGFKIKESIIPMEALCNP